MRLSIFIILTWAVIFVHVSGETSDRYKRSPKPNYVADKSLQTAKETLNVISQAIGKPDKQILQKLLKCLSISAPALGALGTLLFILVPTGSSELSIVTEHLKRLEEKLDTINSKIDSLESLVVLHSALTVMRPSLMQIQHGMRVLSNEFMRPQFESSICPTIIKHIDVILSVANGQSNNYYQSIFELLHKHSNGNKQQLVTLGVLIASHIAQGLTQSIACKLLEKKQDFIDSQNEDSLTYDDIFELMLLFPEYDLNDGFLDNLLNPTQTLRDHISNEVYAYYKPRFEHMNSRLTNLLTSSEDSIYETLHAMVSDLSTQSRSKNEIVNLAFDRLHNRYGDWLRFAVVAFVDPLRVIHRRIPTIPTSIYSGFNPVTEDEICGTISLELPNRQHLLVYYTENTMYQDDSQIDPVALLQTIDAVQKYEFLCSSCGRRSLSSGCYRYPESGLELFKQKLDEIGLHYSAHVISHSGIEVKSTFGKFLVHSKNSPSSVFILKPQIELPKVQMKFEGPIGRFIEPQFCPVGHYIDGFLTKVQSDQGGWMDDSGMTEIAFGCSDQSTVIGSPEFEIQKGTSWGDMKSCPTGFTGARTRIEQFNSWDNTGLNCLELSCNDNHEAIKASGCSNWGDWSDWKMCTGTQKICGVSFQYQSYCGSMGNDASALNGLIFHCCP